MGKTVKLLLSLLVIVATFTLGFEVPVHAAKVKLSKKSITLEVGQKKTIKVKGTTKKVTWSSSDKNIATVSSKGKITAKGEGTCKITAKVGSKKLTCKVTVKPTLETGEGEGDPQEPDQKIENGYWHDDSTVTVKDLQAAAESDLAVFSSYLSNNGWSIIDTSVTRATDTQYGIFVHFGNGAGGESWRMVKAETPDGRGIAVGWYQSYGGSPFDISTNYDDYTNGPYGATDFSLD